ncbi:MAG: hypothetical protein LAT55_07795 [Opitutales bacterium]|nr:hypothetical protein [Opitutales bacterium]
MTSWRKLHDERFRRLLERLQQTLRRSTSTVSASPLSAAPPNPANTTDSTPLAESGPAEAEPKVIDSLAAQPEESISPGAKEATDAEEAPTEGPKEPLTEHQEPHQAKGETARPTQEIPEVPELSPEPQLPEAEVPADFPAQQTKEEKSTEHTSSSHEERPADTTPAASPPSPPPAQEPQGKSSEHSAKAESPGPPPPTPEAAVSSLDPARIRALDFFRHLPWNGQTIQTNQPAPTENTLAKPSPSSAAGSPPRATAASIKDPLTTKAAAFFTALPWKVGQQMAEHEILESFSVRTSGEDVGKAPHEAPTGGNMLMAGMMSAAKTSQKMKSSTPAVPALTPGKSSARQFFTNLNWKAS